MRAKQVVVTILDENGKATHYRFGGEVDTDSRKVDVELAYDASYGNFYSEESLTPRYQFLQDRRMTFTLRY